MKTFVLILITQITFAQISAVIKDKNSKEPIPYVNIVVEDSDLGVSANENGFFSIDEVKPNNFLIFSAVGYEILKIKLEKIDKEVFLKQKIIELKAINVYHRKRNKAYVIGKLNKKEIKSFSANRGVPQINARYIPFNENIKETYYLNTIKVVTRSKLSGVFFNVRLLTLDSNKELVEYYSGGNILAKCKKGMKITEVDVENLDIKFPESGLLVAVEWIINDKNKYTSSYKELNSTTKNKKVEYAPWFGQLIEQENFGWSNTRNSVWRKNEKFEYEYKNQKGKFHTLAVELVLSN